MKVECLFDFHKYPVVDKWIHEFNDWIALNEFDTKDFSFVLETNLSSKNKLWIVISWMYSYDNQNNPNGIITQTHELQSKEIEKILNDFKSLDLEIFKTTIVDQRQKIRDDPNILKNLNPKIEKKRIYLIQQGGQLVEKFEEELTIYDIKNLFNILNDHSESVEDVKLRWLNKNIDNK